MIFNGLKERFWAAGIHLLISAVIAIFAAGLVFGLWYPGDYRYMAGGTELLILIMSVDVVLGPLLTFAVFNRKKSATHLRRDIATIAVLQLAALVYGLHTVSIARPVALVFEFDRFRVISYADVVTSELPQALPEYRKLPLYGQLNIALRRPEPGDERSNALASAVFEGVDTSQRPRFWVSYGAAERLMAATAGRSLTLLVARYPSAEKAIGRMMVGQSLDSKTLVFLPVRAKNDAVAVVGPDGEILGFLPYDGYF